MKPQEYSGCIPEYNPSSCLTFSPQVRVSLCRAMFGLELAVLQPPPLGSRDCDVQLSVCLHWGKVGNALCVKRAENLCSLLRSPAAGGIENSGHLQSTRMHTSLLVAVLPVSAFIIHILHQRNQNSLGEQLSPDLDKGNIDRWTSGLPRSKQIHKTG